MPKTLSVPPGWGQQQPPGAPKPPNKKLWAGTAIAAFVALIAVAGTHHDNSTPTSAKVAAAATAALGAAPTVAPAPPSATAPAQGAAPSSPATQAPAAPTAAPTHSTAAAAPTHKASPTPPPTEDAQPTQAPDTQAPDAPATTPAAAPAGVIMSPTGHYYRAGEFCPDADAGLSTVDAHGTTIYCGMVSGRNHWHY
jgi:hypothetical protein